MSPISRSVGLAVFSVVCLLSSCTTLPAEKAYYQSLGVVDPDLARVGDGHYAGEYTLNPPPGVFVAMKQVSVDVSIRDHSYSDIVVTTEGVKNLDRLKVMRQLILDKQTLQVDALAGATSLTGRAYLKAIESALH